MFLKAVANDLYTRLSGDLSHTAVIFPNKRASLFFNQRLAQCTDRPIWTPTYLTISELFRRLSNLETEDQVKQVCILHRIFKEETGNDQETLDNFYFWGEMLIADFDDLDKNMADADKLFKNLAELKELSEDHSYLTDNQREALAHFFHNFSLEKETELKRRFSELWNVLGRIYHRFRETLAAQGMAYEGQLYRTVIESLTQGDSLSNLPFKQYAFVGFNVLNQVETHLFSELQKAGKALFYWDYDKFYVENLAHEAGEFLRRNLKMFPNALAEETTLFDNLSKPKEVNFIESPTENAQARYVPQWLQTHLTRKENKTAVVLCNEALLQPVLHALPQEGVNALNITMGYPMAHTSIYNLLTLLIDLYTSGYDARRERYAYRPVSALLKHPYIHRLSDKALELEAELTRYNRFYPRAEELHRDEILTRLFPTGEMYTAATCCKALIEALDTVATLFRTNEGVSEGVSNEKKKQESTADEQLQQEALFRCYTKLNRFYKLTEEGELDITLPTLSRLLKSVLGNLSIPFHGEPAIGLQVMGVLETRCLDFRHLLMLSVNEGKLPKGEGNNSFIPYNLRKAFGMTTIEHKNAVYAYYFYRLIQRAEKVTMCYNVSSDGLNRGEMSHFMLQYLIEGKGNRNFKRYALSATQGLADIPRFTYELRPDTCQRLRQRFAGKDPQGKERFLSPSALNEYLNCPLKFYLHYVCNLKKAEEVSTDIENSDFGNIFHRAAEIIYSKDVLCKDGNRIRKEDIEALLKDELRLRECVNRAFNDVFFHLKAEDKADYNGMQLLNKEVILTYLKQLLHCDMAHAPFTLLGTEYPIRGEMTLFSGSDMPFTLTLGGSIDRIDEKDATVRIIDYKTGSKVKKAKDVAQLFDSEKKERPAYILQTLLYSMLLQREITKGKAISPALFYIQKASSTKYDPTVIIGGETVVDASLYMKEYTDKLTDVLEKIFAPDADFPATTVEDNCQFCDFARLCGKSKPKII